MYLIVVKFFQIFLKIWKNYLPNRFIDMIREKKPYTVVNLYAITMYFLFSQNLKNVW